MSLLRTDRELQRDSYYAASAPRRQPFESLQEDLDLDVAIVGGGLAGLSAAIELATRGQRVALLEAGEIGGGASGRNGGQAIHGLACDQDEIEQQLGLDEARRVWSMSLEALALIRQRCAQFQIECDWQDGYLGLATSPRKALALQAWHERMQRDYRAALQWIPPSEIGRWIASPRFHAGLHDPASGHLHPLKYCQGLARAAAGLGVRLFEQSPVTRLERGVTPCLHTAQGRVRARQVLLAGNVYLPELAPQLAPELGARIMPVGTYIVCTEAMARERVEALIPSRSAVCDSNFVLDYFRPTADQRLLYGGRVGYSTATPRSLMHSMRQRMLLSFPQLADVGMQYAWGGFVDISMNRAPDFGRLAGAANVYYLQGFSGHGTALSGLAGRLVAEAMHGDATRFDTFARLRHRPFPGGRLLRTPALVLGMAYYQIKDLLWKPGLTTQRQPQVLVPACNRMMGDHPFHMAGKKYIDAVRLAGCLPLIVPSSTPEELDELLDLADGVLLTGSQSNVHPSHFDEEVHNPALPLDPLRDAWTLPLIPKAIARGLPLFAICRGFQEANVALGGSLHQAVQEQAGLADHRAPAGQPVETQYGLAHPVQIEPGGLLQRILERAQIEVNSLHGQGIKRLAPGLRVEARAPDGLIEAVSVEAAPGFALCLQWHPEWQAASNPVSMALLQAFGQACRDYRDQIREPRHDFKRDPDT